MPTRFQDPKVEIRRDRKRPYYFIRPYVAVATDNGVQRRQKKVPLGFCDGMTLKQAKAAKEQIMAPINAGRFPLQAQLKFDTAVQKFLDAYVPQLGFPTQVKYRSMIERHVRPAFPKLRLSDISPPMVAVWLNSKPGLSWNSRRDLRNLLSTIFTQAIAWRLFEGWNPCEGIELGRKREKREKRIPKAEQLQQFLAALPNTRSVRLTKRG